MVTIKIHSGIVLLCLSLLLAGCSSVPVDVVDSQHQMTIMDEGNIAMEKALNPEARARVLADTMKQKRGKLGGKAIAEEALEFKSWGESGITLPNGQRHIVVVLHQQHMGARIIDGVQYGSFDADSGELRGVRAELRDPAMLPEPPTRDGRQWAEMHDKFREFVKQRYGRAVNFIIHETPVIVAQQTVAGYLAEYSIRNEDGTLNRFSSVIDAKDGQIHVIYDMNTD
ncbi:MAG: hypothetical protein OEZ16_00610 [Chromatiales bacterium]|nr:hypothetical protein [Chromatiales bacterium]